MNIDTLLQKETLTDYELYYLLGELIGVFVDEKGSVFQFEDAISNKSHFDILRDLYGCLKRASEVSKDKQLRLTTLLNKIVPELKKQPVKDEVQSLTDYNRFAYIRGVLSSQIPAEEN